MKIRELYPDVITENLDYEYKVSLNPDNPIKWAKTIIGYANDKGGTIFTWQVDGGIEKDIVIKHFDFMFSWLHAKGFLSAQGEEMYEFGADGSSSISDNDLTDEGSKFMKKYYDIYISKIEYGIREDKKVLDTFLEE